MMEEETRIRVVDVETTMNCPIGNNKANPFWPDNHIVMHGRMGIGDIVEARNDMNTYTGSRISGLWSHGNVTPHLFVGHNLSFDIPYLYKDTKLTPDMVGKNIQIWDTQLAEYILSGQTHMFPSLDELAVKYGGTLKDSAVSDVFKAGNGADTIAPEILETYLKHDLKNTKLVFEKQWEAAEKAGMLPLILSQMEARLATIDMSCNGMKVDHVFINNSIVRLREEVSRLKTSLLIGDVSACHTAHTFDLTSPTQLDVWLRGGEIKTLENTLVGKYKNGKDKYKQISKTLAFYPKIKPLTGSGVGDDVLEEALSGPHLTVGARSLLSMVKSYRSKNKELTTYFESIDKHLMPDGFIHPNHNHCATRTGRLSSSAPNMQNMTDGSKSDVKKGFVSRWGDDGVIVAADYGQLEVVVLAVLSGDKQLCEDIRMGIDIHTALYVDMYGRAPTTEERRDFKRCTFALLYGAGATGIAKQSGFSVADAQRFITTFYERYPGVATLHDGDIEKVKSVRTYSGKKDKDGIPIGESRLPSAVSRRVYCFTEYANRPDVKRWKKEDASFSPTEIKNYPTQGTATGDIVPLVLGILYRVLRNSEVLKDKCLLINTVHDDIVFDVHKSVLDQALMTVKTTMEKAPQYVKETWNFDFTLPLKVGLSVGPNWLQLEKLP